MSELLSVSVVSGFFTILGILIINYFWFMKQEARHKYLKERAKMYQAKKIEKTAVSPPSTIENLAKILPALKDLDLDQIQGLIEQFGPQGLESEENPLGEISEILKNPVVQGFLGQMRKQTPDQIEDQQSKAY